MNFAKHISMYFEIQLKYNRNTVEINCLYDKLIGYNILTYYTTQKQDQ